MILSKNDTERNRIISSLEQLEFKLQKGVAGIVDIKRFGSFTRNTILPRKYDPLSDVDLMVVFDDQFSIKTPGTYRKNLHQFLQTAFPNSISQKDMPVVKLELNHIKFDIVPAYATTSFWDNSKSYFIPDKIGGWQSTIPNDLNTLLDTANQSLGNNILRNAIRLLKCWNAANKYPFDSYVMEKWAVNQLWYSGEDLYGVFLSLLNDLAGSRSGVRQALDYIQKYKGDWFNPADEKKQFEWLQRLLPGL